MRKRFPTHLLFLLLLLVSTSILSQQPEYIIGKLIDAKTQEPIAFASIRIKDRALGIISNTDGSFKIPLKYKEYGDIIEISSMGYQTKEILIQDFLVYELNDVKLQPAILKLEEAIVTAKSKRTKRLTARQIVRRALRSIPENYPVEPFSTVGYYRDYQLDSLQYVNLNEAILEVFDEGFDTTDSVSTKVKIFDYRENTDFKRDTLALGAYDYQSKKGRKVIDKAFLAPYGGNEFTILRVHDALRNYDIDSYSFIHRLQSDMLSEHKLKKESDTYFDEEAFYTIVFEKLLSNYSAFGVLYISKINFAIHKMEYAIYDLTKKLPNGMVNKYKMDNPLIFEIITEYRPKNDKMHLNYISLHNTFQLWDPPKFVVDTLLLNYQKKRFEVYFNKPSLLPDRPSLLPDKPSRLPDVYNSDNYVLMYKGKKIDFSRIDVYILSTNAEQVYLYPKMKPKDLNEMFFSLKENSKQGVYDINLKISNIQDKEGNVINEWTSRDYDQFREFFVQEVKPNVKSPVGNLFMEKRRPIFKDQPMLKPDNFDDYWMNTPLQNIKN
ncbi:carboxypeptidase-like regulatory domain-containing protein [Maribacter antarcticus]|uniref:carboxypeptidase-like regulatory domain-containing protein n=1 Tax=Maribacter antarcticus TaxID=505250 RepID=UPI000B2B01A2|nr:carboxypeptidase-like regulatory domain-containing protein [Maribacter antarcticus]